MCLSINPRKTEELSKTSLPKNHFTRIRNKAKANFTQLAKHCDNHKKQVKKLQEDMPIR